LPLTPRYAADRRLPHPERYIRIDYKELSLARNCFLFIFRFQPLQSLESKLVSLKTWRSIVLTE
jgi:hypothetical protein